MNKPAVFVSLVRRCTQYRNNLLIHHSKHNPSIRQYVRFKNTPAILSEHRLQFQAPLLQVVRNYAKGKNIRKEKGKAKVQINESQLADVVNLDSIRKQMEKAIETLKEDFIKSLSLRSTTGNYKNQLSKHTCLFFHYVNRVHRIFGS